MRAFLVRRRRQVLVTLALLSVWGLFLLASPTAFSNAPIYRSFMSTIPVTLVLTLGMTLLVVLGEMDLSFPSVSAAAAYLFAFLYAKAGWAPPAAFGAALLSGAAMGLVNGLLVVRVGVPSIIATIGTQFFWRGLILLLADGLAISLSSIRGDWLQTLFVGRLCLWEIPAQALWGLAVALLLALLLNRHPFGDALLFIGDNGKTAEMMGLPVARIRIGAFVIMGLLSAFAGLLATLELNNWWPTQGEGYMLLVFAAVFVGGTSAYGGEGTIYGSFVGAILIGIIEAGLVSSGFVGFWTRLVHGLVIILSVSAYALMAKRRGG